MGVKSHTIHMSHAESPLSNKELANAFGAHAKTFQDTGHENYHPEEAPLRHRVHEEILDYMVTPDTDPIVKVSSEGQGELADHLHAEVEQLMGSFGNTLGQVNAVLRNPDRARNTLNEAYKQNPGILKTLNPHGSTDLTLKELNTFIKLNAEATDGSDDPTERHEHFSWLAMNEVIKLWAADRSGNTNPSIQHKDITRHLVEKRRHIDTMRKEALHHLSQTALFGRVADQSNPKADRPDFSGWELPQINRHSKQSTEMGGELDRRIDSIVESARHNTLIYTALPMNEKIVTPDGEQTSTNGYNIFGDLAAPPNLERGLRHLIGNINPKHPNDQDLLLQSESLSPQQLGEIIEVFSFLPAKEGGTYFDYSYNPTRCVDWYKKDLARYPDVTSGRDGNLLMVRVRLPTSVAHELEKYLQQDPYKVRVLVERLVKKRGGVSDDVWQGDEHQGLYPVRPPYGQDRTRPFQIAPIDANNKHWQVVA